MSASKICPAQCTKSLLKLQSKSKKDMSVGWLKVRRTDYETRRLTKLLRNKKLCHMRYLLFWDIWSAYPGMLILSQKIIRL